MPPVHDQPDHQPDQPGKRPPWREPMVWLVAAIPAAAVIATVALLVTASRSSGTADDVADEVRRTAQMQVADLGPDAMARKLRLSAVVRASNARGKELVEVLPVEGQFDRNVPLSLALHHPSHAELDRTLLLAPTATGWRSEDSLDLSHDWNVRLSPAGNGWRLQGRWTSGQQAAYLRPALGSR